MNQSIVADVKLRCVVGAETAPVTDILAEATVTRTEIDVISPVDKTKKCP